MFLKRSETTEPNEQTYVNALKFLMISQIAKVCRRKLGIDGAVRFEDYAIHEKMTSVRDDHTSSRPSVM